MPFENTLQPPVVTWLLGAMQQLPHYMGSQDISREGLGGRFIFESVPGHPAQQNCHNAVFSFGQHKGNSAMLRIV